MKGYLMESVSWQHVPSASIRIHTCGFAYEGLYHT